MEEVDIVTILCAFDGAGTILSCGTSVDEIWDSNGDEELWFENLGSLARVRTRSRSNAAVNAHRLNGDR